MSANSTSCFFTITPHCQTYKLSNREFIVAASDSLSDDLSTVDHGLIFTNLSCRRTLPVVVSLLVIQVKPPVSYFSPL